MLVGLSDPGCWWAGDAGSEAGRRGSRLCFCWVGDQEFGRDLLDAQWVMGEGARRQIGQRLEVKGTSDVATKDAKNHLLD